MVSLVLVVALTCLKIVANWGPLSSPALYKMSRIDSERACPTSLNKRILLGATERCSRRRRWWPRPAGTTATASAASSAASPSTQPRCATAPTTRSTAASATAGSGQSAHLPEFPPTEPTFPTWAGNLNFNHCLVCCRPATGISLLAPTLSRHPVIF